MTPTSRSADGQRATVLAGARVVRPAGIDEGGRVVVTADGRIAGDRADAEVNEGGVNEGGVNEGGASVVDLAGHWLVPGFVDVHVHGGGGASFSEGTARAAMTVIDTHRRHGTTTMLASTVTGGLDELAAQAGVLSELVEQGDLAGIHFEGPFIAASRRGAHDAALLRDPEPAAVAKLLAAARGAARMVTLAPELPGGLEAVRLLREHGVLAALGHTDAGFETTRAAIEAGARVATHLFNTMPPLAHRAPGPVAALLDDERVTVELINDGVHLHPSVLGLAFRTAGAGRVAFVTDAMAAAGIGDGSYALGTLRVTVSDGVARLAGGRPGTGEDSTGGDSECGGVSGAGGGSGVGAIAGSTLTMDRAFRRAVTVDRLPVPEVARALSGTPARLLGLGDRLGSIEEGKDADLAVLDRDLHLVGVMRKGRWVVAPPGAEGPTASRS